MPTLRLLPCALLLALAGCAAEEPAPAEPAPGLPAATEAPPAPATEAPPPAPTAPPSSEDRPDAVRAEFALALGRVTVGMAADEVTALLGAPGDVRTERDPGGVAQGTLEVWRWGTDRHLGFGTLGTVHLDRERRVAHVFGGQGAPPPATIYKERPLRRLLRLIDAVPGFRAPHDPLRLIQAVAALQPLGKARALAVIDEYLRVSSPLDDERGGREGVFLLVRALFDVPQEPGHLPRLLLGAPDPGGPNDPRAMPRFPLAIVGDVPFRVVRGYALGGEPTSPEQDLEWFRERGVLRAKPLAPPDRPLDVLGPLLDQERPEVLALAGWPDEEGRRELAAQALRLVDTAVRVELPAGPFDEAWATARAALDVPLRWDARTARYTREDGTTLPPVVRAPRERRPWRALGAAGATALAVLERRGGLEVGLELEVTTRAGAAVPAVRLRVLGEGDLEVVSVDLPAVAAGDAGTTRGAATGFDLAEGGAVTLELTFEGSEPERSPPLTP